MSACTFFGHRDCPESIKPKLKAKIVDLIECNAVTAFYVGNNGSFDRMVHSILRELYGAYPHITYAVVLAYLPSSGGQGGQDTLLPLGIEKAPRRFAISWRNRWMLKHSEYVVCYVNHSWGGAAQFTDLARRQGKIIFNLCEAPLGG